MITTLVQFKLPQPLTRAQAREAFLGSAPKYRAVPGLIRKVYLLTEDGGTGGGVYFWNSRADAERLFDDEWRRFIRDKYDTEPTVTYFDSPVTVDNVAGEIVSD